MLADCTSCVRQSRIWPCYTICLCFYYPLIVFCTYLPHSTFLFRII